MSGAAARPHYGRTAVADKPHYVYRHYDADGALLYVGCTSDPDVRPYVRQGRPWIDQSAKVVLDGPYEWCEALELEQVSITEGKPLHNKRQRNGSQYRRVVVEMEDQLRRKGMDPAAVRAEDRRIKVRWRELHHQVLVLQRDLRLLKERPRPRKAAVAALEEQIAATIREMNALPDTSYLP